ncbi:MAG: histidine phosphatase family protein [Bacteroidales bacterium]
MKRLFVIRHARSSGKVAGVHDHERPLLPAGKAQIKTIGSKLLSLNVKPDLILCSTALRARQTAQLLAESLDIPADIIEADSELYLIDSRELKFKITQLPDNIHTVFVIGHNPAMTDFVNYFLNPMTDNLPAAGLIGIEFDTENWEQYTKVRHTVVLTCFPY